MKLIILDRDGVINEDSDDYIKSIAEFIPIPGSLEAIGKLCQAGYTIAVATNQSGIARGYYDMATLNAMHTKLQQLLIPYHGHIDQYFVCPHGPDDHCDCRKPKPGLFAQIAAHYQTDILNVPAIGDSLRDIQASQVYGARAILVLTGKGTRTLQAHSADLLHIPIYDNLRKAVEHILAMENAPC